MRPIGRVMVVAALAACGSKSPPVVHDELGSNVARDAAPIAVDAATPAALAVTAGAIAPVLTVGGRRFVDVSLVFDLPGLAAKGADVATWGDGDVESVQLGASPTANAPYVKLRPAPKAPTWLAVAGVSVPGFSIRGAACPSTLGKLFLLSHGPGNEIYEGYEGDQPIVLAQITSPAGCDPILLDTHANPVVATGGKPSAAQRSTLVTAFRALAKSSGWDIGKLGQPAIELFAANGRTFAQVVVEGARPLAQNCGNSYTGARAIYELGTAAPVLRGATDTAFGDARTIALVVHDHDISAVLGEATFDHGNSGTIEYGTILTFVDGKPETAQSTTSRYIGCD